MTFHLGQQRSQAFAIRGMVLLSRLEAGLSAVESGPAEPRDVPIDWHSEFASVSVDEQNNVAVLEQR